MPIDLEKLDWERVGIRIVGKERRFILLQGKNTQKRWKIRKLLPETETAEILGLWFGDGDKVRAIGLSNTQISLIKKFLRFTDLLGLPREKFLVEVTTPFQIKRREISQLLGIPVERIRVKISRISKKPCFRVRFFSRIISRVFHMLLESVTKASPKTKIHFLRGVIAAEGCVGLRKDNKVHEIFISLKDANDREWLKEHFLHPIGLRTNKDSRDSIRIGNKRNLILMKKLGLLALHSEKDSKFSSSFS